MSDLEAQIRDRVNEARNNAQRRAIDADEERDERLAKLADDAEQMADALLAVLDEHKPFLAELTSDGDLTGYQCMGCGPVEDWGSVHYPCETVKAIARGLEIEMKDA